MPIRMMRGESHSMPVATIHAVTAVPTLAPSRTIWAIRGSTRSRSTKEATISAVAGDPCAESGRDAILHLRQAEQQQCHGAEQVDHDDSGFHFDCMSSFSCRRSEA